MQADIRTDWSKKEIAEIYNLPLLELVYKAATVHRKHHDVNKIKINTLISVKTGTCEEDCKYCAQSAHYNTDITSNKFMSLEEVIDNAKKAKSTGVNRVCLSTSGREVNDEDFDKLLTMIKEVKNLGMEACCTIGFLTKEKAEKLAKVGISAFNHNLDTSEEFYPNITSTRNYSDRLNTLKILQQTGISYCSGGIIGMGEKDEDRISLLHTLATMNIHPYTVPINALVPIKGTPLENYPSVTLWEVVRMIATARIIMPKTIVALAAGRLNFTDEGQAICFMAGANSIFFGDKLLTTKNNNIQQDKEMLSILGLQFV